MKYPVFEVILESEEEGETGKDRFLKLAVMV